MITKNKIKQIKNLARKRHRDELRLFVVEGYKSIRELQNAGLRMLDIYVTEDSIELDDLNPTIISQKEMKSISNLKTPPGYLAVVEMLSEQPIPTSGAILALDGIQDPGNLGTIIRLADWFKISHIVCDHRTVDLYNPKVIQATMGSIARVPVHYVDLNTYVASTQLPVYVTTMGGDSIYDHTLPADFIMIMGSESHGVSQELLNLGKSISIPSYGDSTNSAESLNVATATGILLAEWRRSIGT